MSVKSLRRTPTPRTRARLLLWLGAALVSVGVGLVYAPAGVIVAGATLVVLGLYVVDVDAGS